MLGSMANLIMGGGPLKGRGGVRWWEGSVGVREESDIKRVQGRGYVPVEDHGGGVLRWLGQILSAHFLRDEALALLPACGRLVEGVEQLKPVLGNGL
jgi:hypothetical protein